MKTVYLNSAVIGRICYHKEAEQLLVEYLKKKCVTHWMLFKEVDEGTYRSLIISGSESAAEFIKKRIWSAKNNRLLFVGEGATYHAGMMRGETSDFTWKPNVDWMNALNEHSFGATGYF